VITLTDEGTLDSNGATQHRQKKIHSDILGRPRKIEIYDWSGAIYSATVNTYNARDQVTQITQYKGAEGSNTHQETTMNYDGYGRLQSRHVPEQDTNTATVCQLTIVRTMKIWPMTRWAT
jgi:YD repeat-containing protein